MSGPLDRRLGARAEAVDRADGRRDAATVDRHHRVRAPRQYLQEARAGCFSANESYAHRQSVSAATAASNRAQ